MSQHHPDQFPFEQDPNATAQFAYPETAQPAPKKKKRGWLKWGGAGIGAIVLVSAFANTGGEEDATTTAAETSATSETTTTRSIDTDTDVAPVSDESESAQAAPMGNIADERSASTPAEEATETAEQTTASADGVPSEYRSALREAKSYDRIMSMSKQGLHDQLTSEYGGQFSAEAAQYAVDNVGADWNANALEQAESYQDTMNMSPSAIHDQLTSQYGGQFTQAEADYALANLNGGGTGAAQSNDGTPTEHSSALAQAETYADMDMSKQGVYDQLVSEYGGQFSADAAQYAIDNLQADWNANALASARTYQDMDMSPAAIHDQLTSEYGGQFTQAEADYAIANL